MSLNRIILIFTTSQIQLSWNLWLKRPSTCIKVLLLLLWETVGRGEVLAPGNPSKEMELLKGQYGVAID